jgi:hypothetical protein
MPELVHYWNNVTKSRIPIFSVWYWTEMMDAGMLMPVVVILKVPQHEIFDGGFFA